MSDSSAPSRPVQTVRRPLFLLVAVALTMLFGIGGWMTGCQTIEEYRAPPDTFERQIQVLSTAEDRAAARASFEQYTQTMEAAKKRQFPFGVAECLLGAAMLAFTARAWSGRPGARSMLVQLVVAQGLLVLVAFFVTRDARDAWLTHVGLTGSLMSPPDSVERLLWRPQIAAAVASALWSTWVFVRTLLSAMAILLLTRRPTVEFFAALEPARER